MNYAKQIRKIIFFCTILFLVSSRSFGQQTDYKYHSIFIYNFTKYLQWPPSSATEFVIGIVGNSDITPELEKMAQNKMVGAQKIVVKKFSSHSEISACQMLFVPQGQNKHINDIVAKAHKNGTLVITESPGMATKGSNINFVIKDNRWRFELNKKSTEEANIKVSNELVKLSIPVD